MNDSGGPTRVSILGATGSIGSSTLRVLTHNPEQFAVVSLVAQRNVERLAEIALRTRAEFVAIADERQFAALKDHLSGSSIEVGAGGEAVIEAASRRADVVVSAITGYAGLRSTLAAARSGANLALANKEAMVTAGTMVRAALAKGGGALIPVDSEHAALFQSLWGQDRDAITQLILTASGGPFRTWSKEDIQQAAPDQALKHPNWDMGAKVTIDSASMMNKGLELIEAQQIFDIAPDRLDVVVHPQSIVHSLVAYHDGGQLAQLGVPDMQTPISAALRWPKRTKTSVPPLDLAQYGSLTFEPPDRDRFPCLALAEAAMRHGGAAPIAMNAANEVAVRAFLDGAFRFGGIPQVVSEVLDQTVAEAPVSLDEIAVIDADSRTKAHAAVAKFSK
ncbi:1-deoxy-D-xylulose-5-phosphate reductoisomerase [Alphaproteobacteria bacterium]|jgi:1-deoxy-D-xylulose-5-phosphate reductoisomerase|nr:1-deoxy-D-xylulose-5-phosphate reductoisomerase [Alphaproteobacteria bacterium]MDG1413897.1 1-deoxy-D-xylulose-5-phosphate reductoisomerase [Alphaproteobacteria bacterium]